MRRLSRTDQYLVLCLILIISSAYIYVVNYDLIYRYGVFKKMHGVCFIDCDHAPNLCNVSIRGGEYLKLDDGTKILDKEDCFMTFWGGAHFMMWSVAGFFCPDLLWESTAISVGFEYWQYLYTDKHDTLDIFFNMAGFVTGRLVGDFTRL